MATMEVSLDMEQVSAIPGYRSRPLQQTTSRLSRVEVGWFGALVVYKDILRTKEKSC